MRLGRGPGPYCRSGETGGSGGVEGNWTVPLLLHNWGDPRASLPWVLGGAGQVHLGVWEPLPHLPGLQTQPSSWPRCGTLQGLGQVRCPGASSDLPFPNAIPNQNHKTPLGQLEVSTAVGGFRPRGDCSCTRRRGLLDSQAKAQSGKLRKKSHLKATTKIFHKNPLFPLLLFVK